MWLLLYVTLITLPGYSERIGTAYIMERYATEEQCLFVRNRIGFEMANAYPHQRDFLIQCVYKPGRLI